MSLLSLFCAHSPSQFGKTALQLAQTRKHHDCARFIQQVKSGAEPMHRLMQPARSAVHTCHMHLLHGNACTDVEPTRQVLHNTYSNQVRISTSNKLTVDCSRSVMQTATGGFLLIKSPLTANITVIATKHPISH